MAVQHRPVAARLPAIALFVTLVGLLALAYTRWRKPAVVVSSAELAERERALADELGTALTERDKALVREVVIEETVLMREALRRGLHDAAVRGRLAGLMRAELRKGVPPPTPAELQAYYRDHQKDYETGEAISFEQVFFDPMSPDLPKDTATFKSGLKGGEKLRLSRIRARATLGQEFADDLFGLRPGSWEGPLFSADGVHYVRVLERHPPRIPAFSEVSARVHEDWIDARVQALVDELVQRYRVEVD